MTTTASSEATPYDPGSETVVARARRSVNMAIVGPMIVFAAVVALWQIGVFHAIFGFKVYTVPYPDGIIGGIEEHGPKLVDALIESLPASLTGYAAGITVGFSVAALLLLAAPGVANRIIPFLASVNAVPIAALAPLLALWIGPGFQLKVLVIIIMTTPIVVVYTMRGLLSVNPTTLELMASYEAGERTVFRTVRLPTALPFLFTAMKSCVVLALIGTIVTEVVTGFRGIGFVIIASLGAFQTIQGWLALLAVAGIGITWYLLVELAERVIVPWDAATRRRDA
jgi:NitT/TauT family transport system permease protein